MEVEEQTLKFASLNPVSGGMEEAGSCSSGWVASQAWGGEWAPPVAGMGRRSPGNSRRWAPELVPEGRSRGPHSRGFAALRCTFLFVLRFSISCIEGRDSVLF